jgi:hypothetical protein
MARQLQDIAYEIAQKWQTINPAAKAYLRPMFYLVSIKDTYGLESGRDIVNRFLCNSGYWRGEDARRIKAELKEMLK